MFRENKFFLIFFVKKISSIFFLEFFERHDQVECISHARVKNRGKNLYFFFFSFIKYQFGGVSRDDLSRQTIMKNWSTTRVSFREFCVVLFFLCFYFEFLFYINTCVNIFLLCLSVRHDMLSSKIYIFTSKREEKSLNYACAVCLIKHRIFVFEQQSDVRTCSGCASVLVRACSDEKKIEFYTLDVLE